MIEDVCQFILCADDYGMTCGIDQAILALAEGGRVSAVSCIVNGREWSRSAEWMRKLVNIEIGLHVVLTDGMALTGGMTSAASGRLPTQRGLAFLAFMRRIDRANLAREFDAQVTRFADAIGRYPDFIDGHQLVHQLPVISDVLVECITCRGARWRPWLRVCCDEMASILKRKPGRLPAFVASQLGRRLAKIASNAGLCVNDGFSGFYNVHRAEHFPAIFPQFLQGIGPRHLIMCHPGLCKDSSEHSNVWMRCREHELRYLASSAFPADLAGRGLRLAKFSEISKHDCPQ
jgi:chitin disaccharide deacetylase